VINMNTKFPIFGGAPVPYTSGMPVKVPLARSAPSADYIEWTTTAHTGPGVRSVLDTNKQINENAAARIQVMGQRYDIPGRDHVEENRWGVAPSVTYKFNEQTRATFSYIYQHDDSIPDRGLPFYPANLVPAGTVWQPVNVPRNTWYGIKRRPGAYRRACRHSAYRSQLHERHQDHQHHTLRERRPPEPRDAA
jgi:catecholate siderophore receptor